LVTYLSSIINVFRWQDGPVFSNCDERVFTVHTEVMIINNKKGGDLQKLLGNIMAA